MWGSILGPLSYDLSRRQTSEPPRHPSTCITFALTFLSGVISLTQLDDFCKFSGLLCNEEIMLLPKANAYLVCLLGSDLPVLFWEEQNLMDQFFQKAVSLVDHSFFLPCTGSNGFVLPCNFWNCGTENDNFAAQIPGRP